MAVTPSSPVALLLALLVVLWHGPLWAANKPAKGKLGAKQAGFYVQINPRKDSGHPWHGPGDLFVLGGKMVTHLPEAPGAVLCLVSQDGSSACPGQRGEAAAAPAPAPAPAPSPDTAPASSGGKGKPPVLARFSKLVGKKPASPCPSAYNCEFEDIALPADEVFGVVVIDPAMALINLVDAVIVTRQMRTKKDADVAVFDEKLREAVNKLAPPGPFEAKRRLRKFEVRTLDECRKGCKFSQSEITIDID